MFEPLVLNNLIHNDEYCKKTIYYIEPEYFRDKAQRYVFETIADYVGKYSARPTREALAIIASEARMEEHDFGEVVNVIEHMEMPDKSDYKWLIDQTETWMKDQALYNGVMASIAIIEGQDKTRDKNSIPTLLQKALGVSLDTHIGHDYFDDAESQFEYYHSPDNRFAFGIDILNRVTKGGIKSKTLNVVLAPINGGKSIFLIDQAAHWLSQGKNVFYASMEMSERVVRERLDARIFDATFDDVQAMTKEQYMGRVSTIRGQTSGKLKVKEYPTGSAHVGHLRHTLEEMRIKHGFVPDVIFVDYLTIMASSKLPMNSKSNTNTYYTSVAEELRSLAAEYDVPIWSAIQYTRAGQKADNVDMDDSGKAIGIAETADFMLAFMQPEEMIKQGLVIGKVIKNRYNGKNKFGMFQLKRNDDKQKFSDVDMQENLHVISDEDARAEIMMDGKKTTVDLETGEIFKAKPPNKDITGWNI